MLDHLKLNLPECEHIDLQSLGIDWKKFNLDCVAYYNKWRETTKTVRLKNPTPNKPLEEQVKSAYVGYAFYEFSNDILAIINLIANQIETPDTEMYPDSAYESFNTDLYDEFPYIIDVIQKVEAATNKQFGHIKLRYVGPRDVEVIHTDYGNYRYHLPIVTNDNVFFVSNDKLFHMRNNGKLYILDTQIPHTIVNAAATVGRLHLIFADKNIDYTFSNEKLLKTKLKYIEHGEKLLKTISSADAKLNNEVYKDVTRKLTNLKKSLL
jgi:Aspartyl/Asparaginyl beta-hydroxylase